jgi:beta-glucosidase
MKLRLLAALLLALAISPAGAAAPDEIMLFSAGRPLAGWQLMVTDFEGQQALTGTPVSVPKPAQPKVPDSRVGGHIKGDAVTLKFKDSWIAQLRLEGGAPLDLKPFLADGTLELDLNVIDLAQGGLKFKVSCGEACERKLPFLTAGRAAAGKGWQKLSFALSCFARDGDDFGKVPLPFAIEGTGSGEVALAKIRLLRQGKPNMSCPDYRSESLTPTPLLESWAMSWWMPRHQKKLQEFAQQREAGLPVELVFIGDSITQGWENEGRGAWARDFAPLKAINLGFGGDKTENVLWRLQHGELDGMRAKVVVLMIGTNNTGDRQEDPRSTAAAIRRLIDEIQQRQPAAKVLLLAIYPREEKPGPMRAINTRVNELIAKFADERRVFFLDINPHLTNSDGSLSPDLLPDWLHLSPMGYDIVARQISPTVDKLLKQP